MFRTVEKKPIAIGGIFGWREGVKRHHHFVMNGPHFPCLLTTSKAIAIRNLVHIFRRRNKGPHRKRITRLLSKSSEGPTSLSPLALPYVSFLPPTAIFLFLSFFFFFSFVFVQSLTNTLFPQHLSLSTNTCSFKWNEFYQPTLICWSKINLIMHLHGFEFKIYL